MDIFLYKCSLSHFMIFIIMHICKNFIQRLMTFICMFNLCATCLIVFKCSRCYIIILICNFFNTENLAMLELKIHKLINLMFIYLDLFLELSFFLLQFLLILIFIFQFLQFSVRLWCCLSWNIVISIKSIKYSKVETALILIM